MREGEGFNHPAYDIRKRKRVWKAVCKVSGFENNERTDLTRIMLCDVIVVDIKRRAGKMTRIVSIFDWREGELGERPARRLDWQRIIRQRGGGTVLAGDFNTHSQRRDPRCTERRDATYWEGIIDNHGLVIWNDDRPTQYWTRHDSMGESIIDLTLANRPFRKWMILDGRHATGSVHKIIEWELEMEKH